MGSIGLTFLGILLFVSSVFMMLLILVQRGKSGGLTGALGGMGGQSAFGSKAGDVFTKITVITALVWITLCMITIAVYNPPPRDSLNAQRKDSSGSMISTDDESDAAGDGAMTGGDSMGSTDSMGATESMGATDSTDAGSDAEPEMDNAELDQQLENLIEDDIEAPAEIEAEGSGDLSLDDPAAGTTEDDNN